MPMYEFKCKKCKEVYEEYTSYDETNKYADVKCPKCSSSRKTRLMSACRVTFVNPVDTDLWRNSHDYRAKHEINKPGGAVDQRRMAEEQSHMGAQPYNEIDDISSGKYFGEVK